MHDGTTAGLARIAADVAPDVASHLAAASIAAQTDRDMKRLIWSNLLLGTQLLGVLCAAGARTQANTGTFWQHYGRDDADEPGCVYVATKQAFENGLVHSVGASNPRVPH